MTQADDVQVNPYFDASKNAEAQPAALKAKNASAQLQKPAPLPVVEPPELLLQNFQGMFSDEEPSDPGSAEPYSTLTVDSAAPTTPLQPSQPTDALANQPAPEPFSTLATPAVPENGILPLNASPNTNPSASWIPKAPEEPDEPVEEGYSTLADINAPQAIQADPYSVMPTLSEKASQPFSQPSLIARPIGHRQPAAIAQTPEFASNVASQPNDADQAADATVETDMVLAHPLQQEPNTSPTAPTDVEPLANTDSLVLNSSAQPIEELLPPPLPMEEKPRPARLPAIVVEMPSKTTEAKVVSHPRRMPTPKHPGIEVTANEPREDLQAVHWLPSKSSSSEQKATQRYLDKATRELSVRAFASAEHSVWLALHSSAEAVDIADRMTHPNDDRGVESMVQELNRAKTAIREARDFAGKYGQLSVEGVRRIVRSHQTKALKAYQHQDIAPNDAVDLYLNDARVRLSRLAGCQVQAAQAMDLLAAVYLGRGGEKTLADETALTLRRAALQGQPGNGSLALQLGKQLAALGLDHEAKWALTHSVQIEPTRDATELLANVSARLGQRDVALKLMKEVRERFPDQPANPKRVPQVMRVSPEQFAAISRPMMNERSSVKNVQASAEQKPNVPPVVTPAGYQKWSGQNQEQEPAAVAEPEKTSGPRRFLKSIGIFGNKPKQ